MNRLERKLSRLAKSKQKALALFLTAGYPRIDSTVDLVLNLEGAGADIIELGMPFSDPLADGPVIQQCSSVALHNGVTLGTIIDDVKKIRVRSGIPIVLMGYLNPILRYGDEVFFRVISAAGVDGIILPELPLEEAGRFKETIDRNGLSHILLITPTTPGERIEAIDSASSGFVYCVSIRGITGRTDGPPALEYIQEAKKHVNKNPLLVGFGISTPAQAKRYAKEADGVIIGSELLRRIQELGTGVELLQWVRDLNNAVSQLA